MESLSLILPTLLLHYKPLKSPPKSHLSPTNLSKFPIFSKFQSFNSKTFMEEDQALIPGLPDDISSIIIAKIPHRFIPTVRPICRRWRDLLSSHSFLRLRRALNSSENLVFLIQSLAVSSSAEKSAAKSAFSGDPCPPSYALSIYNSTENTWHRLTSPEPIPMFAQIVAVEEKIVLLGGWNAATLESVSDVRILDLVTGEWRKGKPMPAKRSFFACAAVGGKVYVAGGHDGMKNALKTAEIYDVACDEWAAAPAMSEERDECKGVVFKGKFWALSGYRTESQGRFLNTAEWFDVEKAVWGREEAVWPEDGGAAACFAGGESLWCVGRGVREWRGESGWKEAVKLPEGMSGGGCAAEMAGGRVFVMAGDGGAAGEVAGGYGGWVLENGRWRRIETPARFSGFAYSAAAVRI